MPKMIKLLAGAAALFSATVAIASENAGKNTAKSDPPFLARDVAIFDTPWALAFLNGTEMLVTEKGGLVWLVDSQGHKQPVEGVPEVVHDGQLGLLDIAPAPDFAQSGLVYLSYVAPTSKGGSLALARAALTRTDGKAALENLKVIWRDGAMPGGGQPGGVIAFAPDGRHLFLTVGDRMRPRRAQDLSTPQGSIVKLTLDGAPAKGNPFENNVEARPEIWSYGHRNPYGLAFAPNGALWAHEMGPRGGDELNLIKAGSNYGWPLVSNGDQYSGAPIPRHSTRPDLAAPSVYWTPVIAPAGLVFYTQARFSGWRGSALIGGLAGMSLSRITFEDNGAAHEAERWDMEARIRDVAVDSSGYVWVIEDDSEGRLRRLEPK
ncbi:glucose/arabinose dehydrogenase [Rhizobium sp. SG_E_25_P2]|uniref:PQQ-dependent sugar dehydrogenase n=1 Tax=Rhizobium sp. SG_E_25_P2 TaxID=2879942 RepID=UPI002473BA81|nr:PQQ-dependent sugar dehydrogenase [Rhizobium sp. SG_E_25_P2]MDH6266412.1 glucose/arabinose dehydrogenase [Rhizobium sp. SG_E_25_P2]